MNGKAPPKSQETRPNQPDRIGKNDSTQQSRGTLAETGGDTPNITPSLADTTQGEAVAGNNNPNNVLLPRRPGAQGEAIVPSDEAKADTQPASPTQKPEPEDVMRDSPQYRMLNPKQPPKEQK